MARGGRLTSHKFCGFQWFQQVIGFKKAAKGSDPEFLVDIPKLLGSNRSVGSLVETAIEKQAKVLFSYGIVTGIPLSKPKNNKNPTSPLIFLVFQHSLFIHP